LRKSERRTFVLAVVEEQEDTFVRRQFGTLPQNVDNRFSTHAVLSTDYTD
jgi:hypothetical protein